MRAIAMVGAGWLYGLAFPPTAARWLAWIALVPVIVGVRTAPTMRRALALAALFAFVGTCATVDWLPRTVPVFYGQPLWVGIALFVGVAVVMVVPPVTAFGACVRVFARMPAPLRPLLVAAAWTATELWRASVLGGNPWVLAGYSQVGIAPIVQVADLAGVYGIGFVVVAVNAALAEVVLAVAGREARRDAGVAVAVAGTVLAACLAYGHAAVEPDDDAEIPVAVVQGNLDLGSQWVADMYGRNLDTYLRLTLQALRPQQVRLVVWPEAAMTFFLEREPLYRRAIGRVLEPFQAELVAGGPRVREGTSRDEGEAFYNSAFVLEPSGEVRARYDKEHLLPFAEYFPLRIDLLRRSFGRVRSFLPGMPTPPLSTLAGTAGVLICNEAMYPELARDRVRAGAELLLVLTNDTWVADPKFAAIAFDMAALRAVEQRRYVVRASTAGPSAVVTPSGRVTGMLAHDTAAVSTASVAPRRDLTVYGRVGDLFAFVCAAGTVAALVATFARRRRSPDDPAVTRPDPPSPGA